MPSFRRYQMARLDKMRSKGFVPAMPVRDYKDDPYYGQVKPVDLLKSLDIFGEMDDLVTRAAELALVEHICRKLTSEEDLYINDPDS